MDAEADNGIEFGAGSFIRHGNDIFISQFRKRKLCPVGQGMIGREHSNSLTMAKGQIRKFVISGASGSNREIYSAVVSGS